MAKNGKLAAYQKNFGNKGNRMMKQGLPNKAPGKADAMSKNAAAGKECYVGGIGKMGGRKK